MVDTVEFHLQRNGDLLFNFLGGMPRPLRDDLGIGVGHIRIGFDGQSVKREDAPDEKHQRSAQNHKAVAQGKVDQGADHFFSATSVENSRALVTSSSPGLTPSRISCMPSGARPSACTAILRKVLAPSLRKTQSLSWRRMIAVAGTMTRCVSLRERKVATAYMPGRSKPSGLPSTMRTFAERVLGSSTRDMSATVPLNTRSGKAFRRISAESPKCTSPRSFSKTSHTTQTWARSAIVNRLGVLSRLFTPSYPATFCSTMDPVTGALKAISGLGWAGSAPRI